MNEDNERTNFQRSRGKSKIDLNITNNQMLANITNCDISEEESASDHNIIKFSIRLDKHTTHENKFSEPRYRIKENQPNKFYEKLYYNIATTFQMEDKERHTDKIDLELNSQVNENTDIRQFTVKLEDVIQTIRREICRQKNPPNKEAKGKTVCWWKETLKIMRKRTNELGRRYLRKTSNDELTENRKNQYTEAKKEYQAAIRREKIRSWKKYCMTISQNNPWNEVYKLANNKTRSKQMITILQKSDGTKTETMIETLQLMLDQLILEDNHKEDTTYHVTIRKQTKQPLYTTDNKEFTKEEVRQVIESSQPKKAPGTNGITNEIVQLVFKVLPITMTAIYNASLRTGRFPDN